MMSRDWDEVTWGFQSSRRDLESGMLGIFQTGSDEELLERYQARASFGESVYLPTPFMETALLLAGSWQRRPIADVHARGLGARMWASLTDNLRVPLAAERSPSRPLRLRIATTESGVDEIPWEWLTPASTPLALQPGFRVVRSVPVPYPEPPLTVAPPLRVLLLTTNPKDERLLDSYREVQAINQGLQGGGYQVTVMDGTTRDALYRGLALEPHIVHYVGHSAVGQGVGYLILHDERDGSFWLPASGLAKMLPPSVRLLCLSTCFTQPNYNVSGLPRFGHAPADLHLPTTIVNQYAVTEEGAKTFWKRFYPNLLQNGDVVEAVQAARADVAQAVPGQADWASFSLILRDGVGQSFRMSPQAVRDESRFAAELQAQFSARLANELAMRVSELGVNASDSILKGHSEAQADWANLRKQIE